MFFKWIWHIIKKIFPFIDTVLNWIKDNPKKAIAGAAGIGAVGVGTGIYEGKKAKKINKHALEIQQEALNIYNRTYQETSNVLNYLGNQEKTVIDSFQYFANTIERIQKRPRFKTNIFSSVNLPYYEPQEFRNLSCEVQIAIAGVSGAGIGALAGLAVLGPTAVVAAPAILAGGLVGCIKGFSLKNKAIRNKRQAKLLRKNVDEIVSFYSELTSAANSFIYSIDSVYRKYQKYLSIINTIVSVKTNWKEYTPYEKQAVENTVLLARLLYQMCTTPIIKKSENSDKKETVNPQISKLQQQSNKLLKNVA